MAISPTLKEFLDEKHIHYDLIHHPYTENSMETAEAAHVPGDQLAKSVLLKDDQDYLLAVVPSTYMVQVSDLDNQLHRRLDLVTETELADIFTDCELGAIPPIGEAYYIDTIVDERLLHEEHIYIEAGDHTNLLHLDGKNFKKLTSNSKSSAFCRHV